MKYSDTKPQVAQSHISYINERWGQLNSLSKEYSDHAIRFLFLTNAGGAAAVLSFLGASESVRHLLGPKVSLALFILGLITTGVLNARLVHRIERIYQQWRTNVSSYYEDKITWDELTDADAKVSYNNTKEFIFGYAAFGCFILGSLVGIGQFFCQ